MSMLYSDRDKHRVKYEGPENTSAGRSAFRQDYGRLLHSPSFRRLQGKTQLYPGETDFFRNRLTHSLEVAQVAKGMALMLNRHEAFVENPIDTDLVEFAALAHDMGHPPFGHNGEKALDDCMKEHGGFEGNAQTLRLISRIEKKVFADALAEADNQHYCGFAPDGTDRRLGLNATYRSLASILKYDKPIPMRRVRGSKVDKGYYESEAPLVRLIKSHVGKAPKGAKGFKTVECQIMDLADDIAYSTYDLEDGMKGGFVHPLALRAKLSAEPELMHRVHRKVVDEIPDATLREVFRALHDLFYLETIESSDPSLDTMAAFNMSVLVASQGHLRTDFTSHLIDQCLRGVEVVPLPNESVRFSTIRFRRKTHVAVEALKHLNYELMIMSPRLKVVEYRGYDLVCTIFQMLDSENGHLLLPEDYRLMHSSVRAKPLASA